DPEEPEGRDEAQLDLLVAGAAHVLGRGAEVRMLLVERRQPPGLPGAAQLVARQLGEREGVLRVTAPHLVDLSELAQPLERVLADRLEQDEAELVAVVVAPEQALVDE